MHEGPAAAQHRSDFSPLYFLPYSTHLLPNTECGAVLHAAIIQPITAIQYCQQILKIMLIYAQGVKLS